MTPSVSLFVDTSGWAEPVLRNTADHERLTRAYQQAMAEQRSLVTTNYVLAEVMAFLTTRARVARSEILALLNSIRVAPQVHVVHVDPSLDAQAWALLEQASDKAWSLVDAASFVVMRRLRLTQALTTDHHFYQAGFVLIPEGKR